MERELWMLLVKLGNIQSVIKVNSKEAKIYSSFDLLLVDKQMWKNILFHISDDLVFYITNCLSKIHEMFYYSKAHLFSLRNTANTRKAIRIHQFFYLIHVVLFISGHVT